jgi:hypothetical protein
MRRLRIVTLGISGGRCAHSAVDFLRHDCSPYRGYTYDAKVWDLSLVHEPFSVAPCQTLNVTIRNSVSSLHPTWSMERLWQKHEARKSTDAQRGSARKRREKPSAAKTESRYCSSPSGRGGRRYTPLVRWLACCRNAESRPPTGHPSIITCAPQSKMIGDCWSDAPPVVAPRAGGVHPCPATTRGGGGCVSALPLY